MVTVLSIRRQFCHIYYDSKVVYSVVIVVSPIIVNGSCCHTVNYLAEFDSSTCGSAYVYYGAMYLFLNIFNINT